MRAYILGALMTMAVTIPAESADILIVAGNSNSACYGVGAYEYEAANASIYQVTAAGTIVRAVGDCLQHPTVTPGRAGPGVNYARLYAERYERKVIIVPAGFNGAQSTCFVPGAPCYEELVERLDVAFASPGEHRLLGGLFALMENDMLLGRPVNQFRNYLLQMVRGLREAYGYFPITVGEPPRAWAHPARDDYMSMELPRGVAVVKSHSLDSNPGDPIHFNAAAQMQMGKRHFLKQEGIR